MFDIKRIDINKRIPLKDYANSNCKLVAKDPQHFVLKYVVWDSYPCVGCVHAHICEDMPKQEVAHESQQHDRHT